MKRIYLILNVLLVTALAFAQLPQGGKNYNIKNVGANLYLSYVTNDWNVSRINDPSGDADQVWRLVGTDVADVFNLSYDGQYLTKHPNNGWDNVLTTDPTADAASLYSQKQRVVSPFSYLLTEEQRSIMPLNKLALEVLFTSTRQLLITGNCGCLKK